MVFLLLISEIIFNDDGSYEYNELPNSTYFYSSGGFAAYDDQTIFAICNSGIQVLDVANGFGNVQEEVFNSYDSLRLNPSTYSTPIPISSIDFM